MKRTAGVLSMLVALTILLSSCFGGQYITVINTTSHDNTGSHTGSPAEYDKKDTVDVTTTDVDRVEQVELGEGLDALFKAIEEVNKEMAEE